MISPINQTKLRNFHSEFLSALAIEVDAAQSEAARFIEHQVARTNWKHSTGALAKATETQVVRTRRGAKLVIRNKKPYALAQEDGSGTHAGRGFYAIEARRAKALRFVVNGRVFVRRRVMHPGVPATRFLYRAVVSAESHGFQFLRTRMSQVSERFQHRRV